MSNNGAFVTAPSDIVKTYTLEARTQQTYCDIKTSELMKFRRISLPYIFFLFNPLTTLKRIVLLYY